MFFFLTLFTQVVWGYSPLRGGLAYLPFVGAFIVSAGLCSKLVPRFGARVPMTIGAILAPVGMFWLSRVSEHSQYLTGVCLPLVVFAAAAGLIFGLRGSIDRVTNRVFLLSPASIEVTAEDKARIAERGFFNQS